ncbi:MAG: hypothetical protein WC460_00645 [Patescibacteria group bacterium]
MLFRKIIVFFCPLLLFSALELMFFNISLLPYCLAFSALILFIALKYLIKGKLLSFEFLYLSLLPFLFLITTVFFLFILNDNWIRHAIIASFVIISGFYLENIFLYFNQPDVYQLETLENFSSFLILIIFFLLAVNLNSLSVFINLPLWLLSIILLICLTLLLLAGFWFGKLKHELKTVYLLIINIIILEVFWGLSFLPTNFYVSSIILTIFFYFSWGIIKAKLHDELDRKNIWRYLAISSILIFLIIITSSWI